MNGGPARVLDALRRAGGLTCSGEDLSERQGVSRAQIWKHVETLRSRGYTVDAEPGGGYRLVGIPDRLYAEEIQAGLDTRWLGRRIEYRDMTDSTNRVAADLARDGAPHGTAVVAEGQTAGRGRLGRSFFSPPYLNLYTSVLLRPDITTDRAPSWIMAAAVAVADTIAETVDDPDRVEIKWPNDVLVGGLKASGILMELAAEATRVAWLVLGIGVNLNVDPATFPDEFRSLATSLGAHRTTPVDRVSFARRLYEKLEQTLDRCASEGFHGILPSFEARFRMPGRTVRVRELGAGETTGVVEGIDGDGALLLRDAEGAIARVIAGDVTIEKDGAAAPSMTQDLETA